MGSSKRASAPAGIAAVCLFLLALLGVTLTSREFGLHWDCTLFLRESNRFADWFRSWTDPEIEVPSLSDVEYYFGRVHAQPPVYRISTGLAVAVLGDSMGAVYAARLVSSAAYGLVVAGVFFMLRRYGWGAALVGALIFAAFPRIFAFAHLHSVDMLMTCVYFYGVACLPWLLGRKRLGFIFGALLYLVAFLTKVQGFLIPIVHTGWIAVEAILARKGREFPFPIRRAVLLVAVSTIGAAFLFLLLWPYMVFDGLRGLREYVAYITSHGQLNVLYFGKVYAEADFPPWHYVVVMPGITVPLVSLVLLLLGMITSARHTLAARSGKSQRHRPEKESGSIADDGRERLWFLGAFVHLAAMALPNAPKHDGTRLLFMSYPFFALMGGIGFHAVVRWIERAASQHAKSAISHRGTALAVGVVVILIVELVVIFPCQGIYYNQLVGGPRGAVNRGFDGDYLGIYAQGAYPFINRHCERGAVLFLSAANTGNYYGSAAHSLREKDPDLALRPDLRVFAAEQRDRLIASLAPRFAVLGGRLAAYGAAEKELIRSEKPVYTFEEFGVPLLRMYSLPNPEAHLELPDQPVLEFEEVSLLHIESEDKGNKWKALWGCRHPIKRPLAVVFTRRGAPHDPEHWDMFPHLVEPISTIYWAPGDVLRGEYILREPISVEEVQIAVFPHGSRAEDVCFLSPR